MTRVWAVIWFWLFASSAAAQEQAYIQIEAQPSLSEGLDAAEGYAGRLNGVSGFRLGTSWYAITLGPYSEAEAEAQLGQLRLSGQIPGDSYVTSRADYGSRFYPDDGTAAEAPATVAPPEDGTAAEAPETVALPESAAADETVAEARRSERLLSREERALIQTALEDAGAYSGPIDAAFGPGTRSAMAEWQRANGYDATGVLTTAQRAALVDAYRSVLEGLGLQRVVDEAAGIEIAMPTEVVARAGAESPFVRYEPTGDLPARVLLISQEGDAEAFAALYDIMQTLEIVPVDGPRVRRATSFDLEGRGEDFVSTTYAELADGAIKGFTLVWPTGDERRRTRVLGRMRESFGRVPGVLPTPEREEVAAPDLLAGLDVRSPERDRSGFYVDGSGAVLTTAEAVRACQRVTLDETVEADVAAEDEGLGLALLRPRASLSPIRYARFRTSLPDRQSEVAVAGYPYGGMLPAPSLNFGRMAGAEGPGGDESRSRLELEAEPGETGGPVFDHQGAVVGILVPDDSDPRRLPEGVSFATGAGPIADFLSAAGLSPEPTDGGDEVPPEALTRLAADMTVLVRCWN